MINRLDRWADPPLLVLASLADEPKHGYAITRDVAETMGVRLTAGTLYAVIARLEAIGLIEPLASTDRRRPAKAPWHAVWPCILVCLTWTPACCIVLSGGACSIWG